MATNDAEPVQLAYLGGAPLDLRYRVKDPFSIPIQGETISTANLLVKATRRFRVKRQPGAQRSLPPYRAPKEDDVPYDENEEPELRFEMVGHIPKTTRFGGLADYQHIVDPRDEFSKIKSDLVNVEFICCQLLIQILVRVFLDENLIALKVDHTDPQEDDEKLQLLPPPSIAKTTVPNYYKYKPRDTDSTPRRRGRKSGSVKRKEGGLTDSITIDSDFTEDDEI
ncbi:tau 95 subunit of transcription factor TFIIIC [Haplosporangium sp. Z 11]|nr:tau 95 subunit of transcription factor TFIIIC [Haplosporangium sp. Z 11]